MNSTRQQILDHLRDHPYASTNELEQTLSPIPTAQVRANLTTLLNEGAITVDHRNGVNLHLLTHDTNPATNTTPTPETQPEQPLEGWLTEVNTGDIHPREAARLLDELFTRVATQPGWPGVSATLKLLGDLHRDLLVAAKGADRDYPEEATPLAGVFEDRCGPGRIEVGPPYVDGRVTIDPVHGVRAQGKNGEIFHMPAEGGFHRDVAGKPCKSDAMVLALGDHLETLEAGASNLALDVVAWLADQGLLADPPERA